MADTRKDQRAPVSLKVRFKSATVDEFIEHYSKDVSRGGIYIKSSNPMAVGTLLKFQFQLKDESALIKGVGRVVWARAEVDATSESPAGMGIKFIKMDNDSRAMVERIVDTNAPDPGSYVSGRAGATSAEPTSDAPPPGGFFPDLPPAEQPLPEDRTEVRQATQFLANALKEGDDEAAAAEAALKAEQAHKRERELEAQRQADARIKAALSDEPPSEPPPAPAEEDAPKPNLPSMIIDPSLEPRSGRPSEVARETESVPPPRTIAAFGASDDAGEPDTEPPPALRPQQPAQREPTTSVPPVEPKSRSVLPWVAIAAVIAIAAFVALRPAPEETPVEPIAEAPAEPTPAPEPAKVEPAPEPAAPEEKVAEPVGDPSPVAPEDKHPIAGAEVAQVTVKLAVTPPEAEVFVNGAKQAAGITSLELPVGVESTVSAKLKGLLEASKTVTPEQGKRLPAIKLKLKALPYIVHVETTPPGAAINVAGVRGTTPADLVLDKGAPTGELSVTAKMDGYERQLLRIPPSAFTETEDGFRTQLNLTLTAKLPEETSKEATPAEAAPKPPKEPKVNTPAPKPVERATEPPKGEQPTATPPPPAEPVAPAAKTPKAEPVKVEPKPVEPAPAPVAPTP